MNSPINPLHTDPAFAAARELVATSQLGQCLAVYAVARARLSMDDPISSLGLPLIQDLIATAGEEPVSVTAVANRQPGGFEHWSLVLAFPSGLRASVDAGAGLGAAQSDDLDLRLEWTGADRVILVDPARVAATVTNDRGSRRYSAEANPVAEALFAFAQSARAIAADPPGEWRSAAAVIAAARRSAAESRPIPLPLENRAPSR